MKILVIFTGGTIGCPPPDENNTQGYNNIGDKNTKSFKDYMLITDYIKNNKKSASKIVFDTIEAYSKLSENINKSDFNELIKCFKNIKSKKYDGIIITHGTDTLAYTASLSAILLSHLKVPVILVSSNLSLDNKKANGSKNFKDAIEFISLKKYYGTYVFFSYDNKITKVYLASRIKQSEGFIHAYKSVDNNDFGYIKDNNFYPDIGYVSNLELENFNKFSHENLLNKIESIDANILIIKPYPDLNYNIFNIYDNKIDAVLQETYHSYTACTAKTLENSLLEFNNKCKKRGILVYIAPFYDSDIKYSSTVKMLEEGIIPLERTSLECTYIKLLLGYSIYKGDIKNINKFISSNISFEKF